MNTAQKIYTHNHIIHIDDWLHLFYYTEIHKKLADSNKLATKTDEPMPTLDLQQEMNINVKQWKRQIIQIVSLQKLIPMSTMLIDKAMMWNGHV